MMIRKFVFLLVIPLMLSGCFTLTKVGPDYEGPPEVALPKAWNHQLGSQFSSGQQNLSQWWTKLDDPLLNTLVDRASKSNLDVRIATSRIREAEAQFGIAAAGDYPSVDALGSFERSGTSESATGLPSRTESFESIGASAGWELDLFGRIEREQEAAEAAVGASEENYRDVLVVLYAEVVRTYIEARTLQKRLALAQANVANQKETVKVVKARFEAELVSEVDVFRSEQNLASTESSIPVLNAALNRSVNRLAVLLGQAPGTLHQEIMKPMAIPDVPDSTVVAIPRDVMRQRPDIRRAERQLAAQTARIGVATADLYPRLSLGGTMGFSAGSGALLSTASNFWSFGPNLTWNVFDGGRTRSQIKIEDERAEQARAAYEKTVLEAFEQVENSLVDFDEERNRQAYLSKSVEAAEKSVQLAKNQYKNGLTNFQTVLDAERVLFAEQDRLADSEGALVRFLVGIYRSMGGGWDASQAVPDEPERISN